MEIVSKRGISVDEMVYGGLYEINARGIDTTIAVLVNDSGNLTEMENLDVKLFMDMKTGELFYLLKEDFNYINKVKAKLVTY